MKRGGSIGALILNSLIILVVLCVVTMVLFYRSKEEKMKIMFQTLPISIFLIILSVVIFVTDTYMPGVDEEGYTIGFGFILPGMVISLFFTFIMGVSGIVRSWGQDEKFFFSSSILSAGCFLLAAFSWLVFPLITVGSIAWMIRKRMLENNKN